MVLENLLLEIIKTIIWPMVILISIIILKKPLSTLLQKTKHLKYDKLELDFDQRIDRLDQEITKQIPTTSDSDISNFLVQLEFTQLSSISPTSAIQEAWREIENSAKSLIKRKGIELDYNIKTPYKLIQNTLVKGKIVDSNTGEIFEGLRQLRNKVVHSNNYSISEEQSIKYIKISHRLIEYLNKL